MQYSQQMLDETNSTHVIGTLINAQTLFWDKYLGVPASPSGLLHGSCFALGAYGTSLRSPFRIPHAAGFARL